MQHTVSETGGEQERRRLRSAAVTSAQNRLRLCIPHSSASYRHSMKRKERGEEKRIKKKKRGKREGDRRRSIFQVILVSDEICPDLQ